MVDKKDPSQCCGCRACEQSCPTHAITMREDEKGFLYPSINDQACIQCGVCDRVCELNYPGLASEKMPVIYALKHKSTDVKRKSTSGGAFTAISDVMLEDNASVYGAVFDEDWRVHHIRAKDQSTRNQMCGSKYVQSDPENTFSMVKKDIQNGSKVLFTGTPCQIACLKRYLGREDENLYTVDVLCHGVPSPKVWKEFLVLLEKKSHSKILAPSFRDKSDGWSRSSKVHFQYEKSKKNVWGEIAYNQLFWNNLDLRDCCYDCHFRSFSRPSDITIADFWGIQQAAPEIFDEDGVSLLLVNTAKGEELIDYIKSEADLFLRSKEDCRLDQIIEPVYMNPQRDEFWRDYCNKGLKYALNKYTEYSFPRTVVKKVKRRIKRRLHLD